jgi:hypothetical protein
METREASRYNNNELFIYLVEEGYPIHEECIFMACINKNYSLLKYLIEKRKHDKNIQRCIDWACRNNNGLLKYLIRKGASFHKNCENCTFINDYMAEEEIMEFLKGGIRKNTNKSIIQTIAGEKGIIDKIASYLGRIKRNIKRNLKNI